MTGTRDLRLGRMRLPTTFDDIAESLGDQFEAVGGGLNPGSRRARSFNLHLPLSGTTGDANPALQGQRMRRQMRAMMENTRVKLLGIYFQFTADPELNSWLVVGSGELVYVEGNVSLSDFALNLSDCYRVASKRTHRAARRIELYDRRLATTARDFLGQWFGTDWASVAAQPIIYLPVGSTDVTGSGKRVINFGSLAALGGSIPVVAMPTSPSATISHNEVLSYEVSDPSMHLADDVIIYDRRGSSDPAIGYASAILADGPVGYWRLGESAGAAVAIDSSLNGFSGTYVGTPNFGVTPPVNDVNTATGLSGSDAIYMKVGSVAPLNITGDMTIEGWLNPAVGTPNLVPNPQFEADAALWLSQADPNVTVSTFARQTGWAAVGSSSLRLTATSNGSAAAGATAVAATASTVNAFRVRGSITYTAQAVLNVLTAGSGHFIDIVWNDSSGAVISQTTGTTVTGTGVKTVSVTATSPSNAVFGQIQVRSIVGTSGSTDTYIDSVQMTAGSVAPAWGTLRPRYDTVLSKSSTNAGYASYRFAYDAYLNEMVFDVSSGGTTHVYATTVGGGLTNGVWSHVAVVYNATAGLALFYRNGIQTAAIGGLPTSIFASAGTLDVGKWEADQT